MMRVKTMRSLCDISKLLKGLIADELAPLKEELTKGINEVKGKMTAEEVAAYRAQLVEKNKGVLIPGLLKGSTKEELDANLVEALEESKPYITVDFKDAEGKNKKVTLAEKEELEAQQKTAQAELEKRYQGTGAPAAPGKDTPPDPKSLVKDVKNMSAEEYRKHRGEILREGSTIKYGDGE
jgi:hypothetical protein